MSYVDQFDDYLREHRNEAIALTLGIFLALFAKMLLWIGILAYLAVKLYNFEKKRRAKKEAKNATS